MKQTFNIIVERDEEGWYVGTAPDLRGCHTQAKSLDELMERMREAIALCLEADGEVSAPLEFIGLQQLTVEA